MKFYGRKKEVELLKRILSKDVMQTVVLYGRRRIGKSELLKYVLNQQESKYIYYECKQTTELNNVDSLATIIGQVYDFPKPSFQSFEELLKYLFQKSINDSVILVLDEYPYLRDKVDGMDSIIQSLIDQYRNKGKIKFILCGSYIETMKSLVNPKAPLFGRIDRSIHLQAMNYLESSEFYPGFSDKDKVRLYSVFGGIPYYNSMIDESLSVKENMIELIASPNSVLENEVPMYLKSELSKITNANEVIEVLAKGYSKFTDILSQSHVTSSPTLVNVLDKLIQMEIVRKDMPINDENNKKKTMYRISDQLTMFYYRYCFHYSSQMRIMDSDVFYQKYIHTDFESQYVPHVFENICRQYLIYQNMMGFIEEPFEKIGRYWYDNPKEKTNGEFDIVTEDAKGYIFYEAKFRNKPITQDIIDKEIFQVNQTNLNCYKYGFVSASGFQDVKQDGSIQYITLSDVFKRV